MKVKYSDEPLVRDVSDTARWVAVYRAGETERPDALFRDPFARRLAGERGEAIAASAPFFEKAAWSFVARTVLFDRFVEEGVRAGADLVLNLAAGLDTRPYRMALPPSLKWVEVDHPGILSYKEEVLASEKPTCALERVPLDLADVPGRRALFGRLGEASRRALVLSEGLLIYLAAPDVAALARDLAAPASFRNWVVDIVSPGLAKMIGKEAATPLAGSGAAFRFAPREGPGFFAPSGWKAVDVRSPLKTAARLGRLSFGLRLAAMLPDSSGAQGSRPWSGICLLEKA